MSADKDMIGRNKIQETNNFRTRVFSSCSSYRSHLSLETAAPETNIMLCSPPKPKKFTYNKWYIHPSQRLKQNKAL